ncbi:hypothetical protein KY312_00255 [Candidatus Woesearchaeota archaeon]|nr:hypothetical protein [Candidatus Woesearchaeota archaeon]
MAIPKAKTKKSKGLIGIILPAIFKVSTLYGIIIGFTCQEYIERGIDYFLYRNVPVSQQSYQDPRAVDVKIYNNEIGERQAYLIANGREECRYALDKDLLPVQDKLEEMLAKRCKNMTPRQARQYLLSLGKQAEILKSKMEGK